MANEFVSKAVIKRLPRYYRYLGELMNEGVEKISSAGLSEKMHVTASQIRQDLNNFGGFGQQRYGYNVKNLHNEIGLILGLDQPKNIIIAGAGNIGKALSKASDFSQHGFNILAFFDTDPAKIDPEKTIPVYDMSSIRDFTSKNKVDIGVIAVPGKYAFKTAHTFIECGIKAIWNFALVDLDPAVPKDVVIESVHLSESLMTLSYNIKASEEKK